MSEETTIPPPLPREGPGAPTEAGSLDLGEQKDRALVRQAARRRWPVPDELKRDSVCALDAALRVARETSDVDQMIDVVRTLAVIEGQNQDDEHLAEKHGRIDLGKATERVEGQLGGVVMQIVGPKRE